jgi:multiple sugar transport system substrate-binding protein
MVEAWNSAHPTETVSAQEIPAGQTSEAVIAASITAGNTPCLIYNTSPAAVPNFQAQGGLVPLDDFSDGASYIRERTGSSGDQYKSPDGKFYQLPWKANPVMIFYNKDHGAHTRGWVRHRAALTRPDTRRLCQRVVRSAAAGDHRRGRGAPGHAGPGPVDMPWGITSSRRDGTVSTRQPTSTW